MIKQSIKFIDIAMGARPHKRVGTGHGPMGFVQTRRVVGGVGSKKEVVESART